MLLVDGRVLDDHHPGVRRFWVPILCAWADRGGQGMVAHRRACAPEPSLIAAGFAAIELRHSPYDPRGVLATRSIVQRSGAGTTLSPLYLTLDGARRNLATVFDLVGRTHPRSRRSRWLWELMMWRSIHGASGIICATAAVIDELGRTFPGARGRTELVSAIAPPAPFAAPEGGRAGIGGAYALAIASHRPHKRLDILAATWRAAAPSLPLVILGAGTERLHAPPLVHGLGFVSDAEVDRWLGAAACLISASRAEGFGLPVLAALAWGVPVVSTRHPALEEVAGDAACWSDIDDVAGLVHGAQAIVADPSASKVRVERGRLLAQQFTPMRAAQQLASVI